MRYKAILFDLEGTLVDFQWKMVEAVQEGLEALSDFGFDTRIFNGCDYAGLFNRAMDESERLGMSAERVREKIGEIYDRFDIEALSRWALKSDVKYVLQNLRDQGIMTALVTNVGEKAVSLVLRRFGLDDMLQPIITRNSVKRLKPNSEGILHALDLLGVGKRETLFVGDSVTDILASREVGTDIAVVLGGENKREDIIAHEPDFLLETLGEILRIQ